MSEYYCYGNEKIWDKCQTEGTSTEGIYKSRGLHKAYNKGGIPLLVIYIISWTFCYRPLFN